MTQTDSFSHLISDAQRFLSELARNNSPDWFNENKARYTDLLKTPATLLGEQVLSDLARQDSGPWSFKLFRPHRDVRFSKDKTPYNTHLHMLWAAGSGAGCGLFFGVSPDYVKIGGGIMGFDKEQLLAWRQSVDGDADVAQIIADSQNAGYFPSEPELKRVPAPFDKDHPRADLLRRKSLAVWTDLPPTQFETPTSALRNAAQDLRPLFNALDAAL